MKRVGFLIIFHFIIIGFFGYWFFTSEKVACAPCPKEKTILSTITPTNKLTAEEILFERNNIYGCSMTEKAEFNLIKSAQVTKIRSWFSWQKDETETAYTLTKGKEMITQGILKRKDCDPYQKQWCIAIDENFNKNLEAGDYLLEIPAGRVCQNKQSENKGFVFIYGNWK